MALYCFLLTALTTDIGFTQHSFLNLCHLLFNKILEQIKNNEVESTWKFRDSQPQPKIYRFL